MTAKDLAQPDERVQYLLLSIRAARSESGADSDATNDTPTLRATLEALRLDGYEAEHVIAQVRNLWLCE